MSAIKVTGIDKVLAALDATQQAVQSTLPSGLIDEAEQARLRVMELTPMDTDETAMKWTVTAPQRDGAKTRVLVDHPFNDPTSIHQTRGTPTHHPGGGGYARWSLLEGLEYGTSAHGPVKAPALVFEIDGRTIVTKWVRGTQPHAMTGKAAVESRKRVMVRLAQEVVAAVTDKWKR